MKDNAKTPGRRIRQRRRSLGLSVQELAARCYVHPQRIYALERLTADDDPRVKTIEYIAAALGVSPAWIMGWEEEKKETHEPQYEQI